MYSFSLLCKTRTHFKVCFTLKHNHDLHTKHYNNVTCKSIPAHSLPHCKNTTTTTTPDNHSSTYLDFAEFVAFLVDADHDLVYDTCFTTLHESTAITLGKAPTCTLQLQAKTYTEMFRTCQHFVRIDTGHWNI